MAGAGKKTFTAGETLTASDVNSYLMEQSVMNFGGTAARASAIPTPTTGMTTYIGTTGTASIPQIETYTGSQWQTPYGLTQLANVTFSGATSIAVANVFSSTYDSYRIVFRGQVATTRQIIYLQMTGASTNYFWGVAGWRASGSAYNANSSNTLPGFITTLADLDSRNYAVIDVGAPALAQLTSFASTFVGGDASSPLNGTAGGFLLDSTVYNGFTLTASNNISGTVRVYGYRNS